MDKAKALRFWLYFKLYLIAVAIVFIVGAIFCSWICIFPSTAGVITVVLWYRHAKKELKQKGVLNSKQER